MVGNSISLFFCDFSGTNSDTFGALSQHLPPVEAARLSRLLRSESRHQKIVSRSLVRYGASLSLGRPLGTGDIVFPPGQAPALRADVSETPLHISVSHSGAGVMAVLSGTGPVGLDLQRQGRSRHWRRMAEHCFSAPENALLRAAPPEQAEALFYRLWCLKEALAKAAALDLVSALAGDMSDVTAESKTGERLWQETGGHPGYWMTTWLQGTYAAALVAPRPSSLTITTVTVAQLLVAVRRDAAGADVA